jgi:hypothetical protein
MMLCFSAQSVHSIMGAMEKRRSNILLSLNFPTSADRSRLWADKGPFHFFSISWRDFLPRAVTFPYLPERRAVRRCCEIGRDTFLITTASILTSHPVRRLERSSSGAK